MGIGIKFQSMVRPWWGWRWDSYERECGQLGRVLGSWTGGAEAAGEGALGRQVERGY